MKTKSFFLLSAPLRLCVMLCLFASVARTPAQPYYTNTASGSFFGAQQYNQNYPNPLQPGQTMTAQYRNGINAGTGNSGIWSYATNTFATNYPYAAIPAVTVQQYGAATALNQTNQVITVTTTNYIVWFGGATNVNYSVIAIGH